MRSKISIFLLVSVSIIFVYGNQNPQWKGTIEEEEGVKVIKNPNEPLFGEITFDLEEDLSIGNEEDENYTFYRIGSPVIDSEGNILVLDRANFRIQKYDREGKYLQTIGRQGQGPGEFEQPWTMCVDKQQNIYIRDVRDIDIFDENGRHIKSTIQSERFGPFFGITRDGNIIAYSQSIRPGETLEDVVLIDKTGKKIKTIVTYKSDASFGKGIDLGRAYTPGLRFDQINEELALYGYSSEYKLYVIDSSGNLVHIIEKAEPPTPLSQKEINKVLDDYIERQKERKIGQKYSRSELKKTSKFPKNFSFFVGFQVDDKGRIYVTRFKSRLDDYKGAYYDIFSKDGFYLYRAKISPYARIVKNECVYVTEYDEDTGYRKIKRYKIKNWAQIREGVQ